MINFWGIVAIICAIILALIWLGSRGGQIWESTRKAAADSLRSAQVEELERSIAQGIILEEEARAIRIDIERAHARTTRRGEDRETTAGPKTLLWGLISAAFILAIISYTKLGIPGLEDLSARKRASLEHPSQALMMEEIAKQGLSPKIVALDTETQALADQLEEAIAKNPEIAEGYYHLHTLKRASGDLVGAYQAQEKYIALKGSQTKADDYALLAEEMIMAALGYVSPEAEGALIKALEIDPENMVAQYYMASRIRQAGDLEGARQRFLALKPKIGNNPAWIEEINKQLSEIDASIASKAGANLNEIQNTSENMIIEMVEGLKTRLTENGGTADEWAQLVKSLRVLGRREEADQYLAEALAQYKDAPALLELQ